MEENTIFEPSIVEAARQYPSLVAATAVAFAVLSFFVARLFLNDWVAEATILIEDPAASQVFDTASSTQPERYLASQVALLESAEMAESVLRQIADDETLTVRQILRSREVVTSRDTDLVAVAFVDTDPELAIRYANAYGEAYESYREEVTASSFLSAISGLDDSIAAVDTELAAVDAEIDALTAVPGGSDLEQQLQQAITEFLASSPDAESAAQLEEILSQLQTLQVIRSLESQNPNLVLLLETRRDVMDRRSQLVVRRDQLQVDSVLASTGIVARSAATEAERSMSTSRVVGLGLVLGLLVGVALAYVRVLSNRRFGHRTEPEVVLDVPMLAEVPKFGAFGAVELLPVLNEPSSAAAEAFRFAGNAIVARMNQLELQTGVPHQVIVVTSALLGDGKTVVTVNTGLSVATRGKSVLIVDGDFGDPTLSRMLVGEAADSKGITDVVNDVANLSDVVIPVNLGQGHHVDVLTRGTVDIAAGDFFNSSETHELFQLIRKRYDYILVDAPPLLQVSYATSVVALADGVVNVIPHEGRVSIQQELADRLDLIGASIVGYVYNKAPKRPELLERKGSMRDPLGIGLASSE